MVLRCWVCLIAINAIYVHTFERNVYLIAPVLSAKGQTDVTFPDKNLSRYFCTYMIDKYFINLSTCQLENRYYMYTSLAPEKATTVDLRVSFRATKSPNE